MTTCMFIYNKFQNSHVFVKNCRFGRRPIFFISLVIQVIAGVLAGIAPDFYSFTFFRMVVGSTTSGVFLVAYVIGK